VSRGWAALGRAGELRSGWSESRDGAASNGSWLLAARPPVGRWVGWQAGVPSPTSAHDPGTVSLQGASGSAALARCFAACGLVPAEHSGCGAELRRRRVWRGLPAGTWAWGIAGRCSEPEGPSHLPRPAPRSPSTCRRGDALAVHTNVHLRGPGKSSPRVAQRRRAHRSAGLAPAAAMDTM